VCARVDLLYRLAVVGASSPSISEWSALVIRQAFAQASQIPAHRRIGSWYEWILARLALAQVHRLPYMADPPSADCYRDVDLTARYGGECKALNVFFVALLLRLGLRAEVVWIMQPGRPLNHVSSVVWLGGMPRWADASIGGAQVGESPYEALQRTGAWHVVGRRVA
jgi:hypothetical protein